MGPRRAGEGGAIRAVLDTSTLVGSARRRDLQEAAALGLFEAIRSPWIVAELNRVLTWRAIERSGGDLSAARYKRLSVSSKAMMGYLTATFVVGDPKPPHPPPWDDLADPGDVPIWAAAKTSGATHVVSENTDDYPPRQPDGRHTYEGIEYLTRTADTLRYASVSMRFETRLDRWSHRYCW